MPFKKPIYEHNKEKPTPEGSGPSLERIREEVFTRFLREIIENKCKDKNKKLSEMSEEEAKETIRESLSVFYERYPDLSEDLKRRVIEQVLAKFGVKNIDEYLQ